MRGRLIAAVLVVCAVCGCVLTQQSVGKMPDNSGVLAIKCNVKGADVYVDNALVATIQNAGSRQDVVIASGDREIRVQKFGYLPYQEKVSLVAGARNTIDVTLQREPTKAVEVK